MEFKSSLKPTLLVIAACGLLFLGLTVQTTRQVAADAAPPPEAAASDITPGQGTQVQMANEKVVLDIHDEPVTVNSSIYTRTVASVTADFTMRNLGQAAETLDVRFPLNYPIAELNRPADFPIEAIQTLVDNQEVKNTQQSFSGAPWAVWSVSFPPGRDVHLTVKYRARGVGWYSLLDFYYILETGAGWRGPIGSGDIIFRFPAPASQEMYESNDAFITPTYPARTPQFIVEGNQLRWHFENLEPTSHDNVRLFVLKPELWQAILDAREQARLKPDNVAAQLQLAQAYYAALPIKNVWPTESALTEHFGALADTAFGRAIALAPNDAAVHLAYARFLSARAWSLVPEPYYSQARRELARAVELEGEDDETRLVSGQLDMIRDNWLVTPTPEPPRPSQLAYIQNGDVWVKELPDGEPRRLTADGRNNSPRWSVSGEWVAFHKDTPLPSSDSGTRVAVRNQTGTAAQVFSNCTTDWSPVSDTLLCTLTDGRLGAVAVDGAHQGELPLASRGITYHSTSAWSPDGKWLAYDHLETLKEGAPPERSASLWRMRSDSSDALELLNNGKPSQDGLICAGWSRASQQILFWPDPDFSASILADGVPLQAISINGGKPYTLTAETLLHSDWMDSSRDGLLALTEGGDRETWTNKRIIVVNPATGIKTLLTDAKTAAISPAWSPDGQRIAYVAAPDIGAVGGGDPAKAGMAQRRIWVMNRDGSNKQQLTNDPAFRDERPLWSGDGQSIIFVRLDNSTDKTSLWLIPSNGGEPRRIVDELATLPPETTWFGYYGHIDWSNYFDLWTPASPTQVPDTGGVPADLLPLLVVGGLMILLSIGLLKASNR